MFDINWGELVVIGGVALIVIGPKELPAVLRTVGQWTTKIRRMAGEFQSQFQEAMREAEMADLKKEVDNIADAAKDLSSSMASPFDPLDFKEGTPWEPKAEDRSADKSGEADKAGKIEDAAQSAPPAAAVAPGLAAVVPDGDASPSVAAEAAIAEAASGAPDAAPAQPATPGPERSGPA